MNEAVALIALHQLVYQGMFFAKNFFLRRRLGKSIRGTNREASVFIGFFVVFLGFTLFEALHSDRGIAPPSTMDTVTYILGILLMAASVIVAWASLRDLGDSWRVGVIEEQQTELVKTGIYRFTRNPYFVAYLILFAAYTVFLQSTSLLILSAVGFGLIHRLVRREEAHLSAQHGESYREFKAAVPRYLWW
ncbi:isoprenylcysteine carboxylmethyltransferase family protein [Pseudohalioglobus sediminis]|uniref:Isoprenylcysteine carboxylmethyltransferase family protein n=1 Tax=Pseudohalioglobus sediminis TaxID=2606449 RepID=A0A5B0X3J9_9GAMM|nr:isoprenylcysteine carboxylmethyltransferase family protein [Pseudohalioglobus sediminis]KAA1193954.1 isoprenylcysteine carboxylmethyltransferase family protein [Pseudohalioglobus sediminis]